MTNNLKDIVRQYVEMVWNSGDQEAFYRLTTPNFTYQVARHPARNQSEMIKFLRTFRSAFPDWRVQIDNMIAEDKQVAISWSGSVTHLGDFSGIPATGKKIIVGGINIYQFAGDRIAAEFEQTDTIGMVQQMGVLPVI